MNREIKFIKRKLKIPFIKKNIEKNMIKSVLRDCD